VIRAICHTQVNKAISQKKAHIKEIQVNGGLVLPVVHGQCLRFEAVCLKDFLLIVLQDSRPCPCVGRHP